MQVNTQSRLRILLAGGALTEAEARRFEKVFSGKRRFLPILGFAVAGLLFTGYIPSMIAQQPTWYEKMLVVGLLTAGCLLALTTFLLLLRYPDTLWQQQWNAYAADTKSRSPRRIEVYDDRIIEITARYTKKIPFEDVKLIAETADGFAVSNGHTCLVLRAADMTAFDIAATRLLFKQKVQNGRWFQKEVARTGRAVPLPIPKTESLKSVEWLCAVCKPFVKTNLYSRVFKKRLSLLLGLELAMTVLLPLVSITLVGDPLFSTFFLTQLFTFGGILLVTTFVYLALVRGKNEQEVTFIFMPDGVMPIYRGNTQFFPKEGITFEKEKRGVAVRFLGEPLFRFSGEEWQTFITLDKIEHSTNE